MHYTVSVIAGRVGAPLLVGWSDIIGNKSSVFFAEEITGREHSFSSFTEFEFFKDLCL
jgi:hypothetical protein